jgi:hypothetical protein
VRGLKKVVRKTKRMCVSPLVTRFAELTFLESETPIPPEHEAAAIENLETVI